MKNKYMRTADEEIYLRDKRYSAPKENFKQIASLLKLSEAGGQTSLLDIGCATGEFLYYVRQLNENINLYGVEFSERLVNESLEFLSENNINISVGDANNLLAIEDNSYDFITTIGVTSIFDDFRPSFNEMIRVSKPRAWCLNHMLLNEMNIDVIIKYLSPGSSVLESGWNKFSIKSVKQHLQDCPVVKNLQFIKHEMPFDLEKKEDLMRSWTQIINGERVLWNGLNMEISLYHVLFEVQK